MILATGQSCGGVIRERIFAPPSYSSYEP